MQTRSVLDGKSRVRRQHRSGRLIVEVMEARLLLSTFIVNSDDDLDFGTCSVLHCSLREAISMANAMSGPDVIQFDIPGSGVPTIRPQGPLPEVTEAVSIEGTSQPAGKVELDGTDAGARTDGIVVTGGGCTLQGLVINRFSGSGIHLKTNGGNFIVGNLIGTDVMGSADLGNADAGIFVDESPANLIGTGIATGRNIISGNETQGIAVFGNGASGNQVLGNFIGTDATGMRDLGNGDSGVLIDNAPNNTIGGADSGFGNVISGNEAAGVTLFRSGASRNTLAGNLIGTDMTGTADLGNGFDGVLLNGAPNNLIGGTASGARNVISGNDQYGVELFRSGATNNLIQGNFIGTDSTGTMPLGNSLQGVLLNGAPSNTIGGTSAAARNVISGNRSSGVYLFRSGASANVIEGNYIGTDVTGTAVLGNSNHGVIIDGAPGNMIGGHADGSGNVISANGFDGIQITREESRENVVAGNWIGVDATGSVGLGNRFSGISVRGVSANTIGGTSKTARNIISANQTNGIFIDGAATENLVQGNYIGTDASGTAALGNSFPGVFIGTPASRNTIGGDVVGAGNLISGNKLDGVQISGALATENQVLGNLIGTDVTGAIDLGNGSIGVAIRGASGNTIGGVTAAARNIISGNDLNGAYIDGTATGNVLQGNFVGTDIAGTTALGNRFNGVFLSGNTTRNTIGGTVEGAGNVISGNGLDGVQIAGFGAAENQVLGNLIGTDLTGSKPVGNSGRGIFLSLSARNTIGGSSAGAGNLISASGEAGIRIAFGAAENVVQGNLIGTDRAGLQAIGNLGAGVAIDDAPDNIIGGTKARAGNVISGNHSDGIAISGFDSDSELIQGNLIGTDITGTAAVPNAGAGVSIDGPAGAMIGGIVAEARNVISGNGGAGVLLSHAFSFNDEVVVQGNFIGTTVDGVSPLGNADSGVRLHFSSPLTIGGHEPRAGNVIAFNGGNGVTVIPIPEPDFFVFGNSILSNSIFSNSGLGIDLGDDGVTSKATANDDLNRFDHPNPPVLKRAVAGAPSIVRGTLTSTPRTRFLLQFFSNQVLDPSSFGEGELLVGSAEVRTNRQGSAIFRIALSSSVKAGEFVTATATDADGHTSEFSRGIRGREPRATVRNRASRQPDDNLLPNATSPAPVISADISAESRRNETRSVRNRQIAGPLKLTRIGSPPVTTVAISTGHADQLVDLALVDWQSWQMI